MKQRIAEFRGRGAKLQFALLMLLYRFAVNRWLYGIFCRSLARMFSSENAVSLKLSARSHYWIYLNDGYWTRFLLYHDSYEPEVQHTIDAAAGNTDLFCDLGANKGLWSVYASPKFARVVAVEASQETFRYLEENTTALANVERHRAAIFGRSGESLSFVNTHNSHASARLSAARDHGAKDTVETVKTICVDDLVPAGEAALIKLDVEGAEIAAIEGSARALSEGSVLIYEDHGSDRDSETSAFLLSHADICIYAIEAAPVEIPRVEDLKAVKTDPYKGYNFLAARSDSRLLTVILEGFANRNLGK